jgi:hypothetical protein
VGSENLFTLLALRATEDKTRKECEMAVRIEKIFCTLLDEAHRRQVEGNDRKPSPRDQRNSTRVSWIQSSGLCLVPYFPYLCTIEFDKK